MGEEVPLQSSLFNDQPQDTRTRRQRRKAKLASLPQPMEMFSTREVAQFGVRLSPMNLTTRGGGRLKMQLEMEDPRTEEEKEADRQKEAEQRTYPLFGSLSDQQLEQAEALVTDLGLITQQLLELMAVATVILEQSTETLDQLGLMLTGSGATMSDGDKAKARSNGLLHPPEEIAKTDANLFGPGFHIYRSMELWPSARAGEL
jgi:hypothetical protein